MVKKRPSSTWIGELFEESEEELKESIKEAEDTIKEARKKLGEIQKRKKIPRKPIKKKYIIIPLLVIILIAALTFAVYKYATAFHYVCKEPNPCKECKVTSSCIAVEEIYSKARNETETYVHFTIKNQNSLTGDCYTQIVLETGKEVLSNKTYGIGQIESGRSTVRKIPIELPYGTSNITVIPSCIWK